MVIDWVESNLVWNLTRNFKIEQAHSGKANKGARNVERAQSSKDGPIP